MDTAALAASFPFTSPDLPRDPAAPSALPGVLYGVNTAGPGLVAWDRWAADNHNSVTLAASGAGKSLPGQAGDPPVPVPGHRVLGDRPRGRVRAARRGDRRRVHPPRRAGRPPEPVRPARRRAGEAGHPHPPRPVHPHRRRGAAAGRAVPGRAGRPGQGDHDRLPAGRHQRRPAHLGAARPAAARPGDRAARRQDRGRADAGRPARPVHRGHPLRPVRRPDHHPPRGPPGRLQPPRRPRRAAARPRRCSPWTPPGARSPTPPSAGGG